MISERPRAAKRVALNMKAAPQLRARIDGAAEESGLSVAQEVERRLIDSFRAEDALGGRSTAAFLRSLAATIDLAEAATGKTWREDWETFAAIRKSTNILLDSNAPPTPRMVEALARKTSVAETEDKEAWSRLQERAGMATAVAATGLSQYIPATSNLPAVDPQTGNPWTAEGLKEVGELMDDLTKRRDAHREARRALSKTLEPVEAARQRGLALADQLLGSEYKAR